MYTATGLERLRPLDPALPEMDTGAPCPAVAATEHTAVLAYYASAGVQDELDDQDAVAVVVFAGLTAVMFGPPNDEALNGHPLYGAGLQFYEPAEVSPSPWAARLEEINSVHPHHRSGVFSGRHVLVPFHDKTFECICRAVTVGPFASGSTRLAAAAAFGALPED